MEVYHGTPNEFSVFSHDYRGLNTGNNGYIGHGFYFTPTEEFARFYGDKVKSVYLNVKNPLYLSDLEEYRGYSGNIGYGSLAETIQLAREFPDYVKDRRVELVDEKGNVKEVTYQELNRIVDEVMDNVKFEIEDGKDWNGFPIKNVKADPTVYRETLPNGKTVEWTEYGYETSWVPSKRMDMLAIAESYLREHGVDGYRLTGKLEGVNIEDISEYAKSKGYDGIIPLREGNAEELVVFDPEQIKTADPVTRDDNGNVIPLSERFNEERKDIRYSVAPEDRNSESYKKESEEIFSKAKERFGTTNDMREAGYILPDGTMLDFSGRHELFGADDSGVKGHRYTDHRVISSLAYGYDADGNEVDTGIKTDMPDFIERGAIRIDYNAGSINLSSKPTPEQERVISSFVKRKDGYVTVEIGNGWDTEHYGEYDYGTRHTKVLGDIDNYFDNGIRFSVDKEDENGEGLGDNDMFDEDDEAFGDNRADEARRAIDEEAGDDWNTHEAVSFRNALMTLAEKNKDDLEKRDNSLNKNIEYLTELRKQLLTPKEYDDKAGVAVRRSAAVQRKYDRRVAEDIVRFAKALMEHQAVDNMTLYQTSRLISMMRDAAGGKDIVGQARKVVDLMLNQQLRGLKSVLARQMRIKGTKVSGKGVEVQGKLDVRGANMVRAMKSAMGLSEKALNERIADCEERMGSKDELIRKEAEAEYDGLSLARQYQEEIKSREEDAAAIREQMRQEMNRFRPNNDGLKGEDRKRAYAEHEELMQSYQDALFENMEEQATAYRNLLSNLGVGIQSGIKRAEEFRNKERQRVDDIHHDANSDLEGVSAEAHRDLSLRQKANNWVIFRPFMKPMATFDYMLRFFGGKNATGEGYLFRRFMGDWTDASNKHWRGLQESYSELDSKAREIFGNEVKRWSDLFELERHMKGMKVEFTDDGERREHELTQGNMLYIYMVNKMTDGKMKLRKMGITEEDVAKIKEELDPRFVELADWMQNDYLVKKRTKYNEVHERMFGASMAAIENYFPLKINDRSRHQEVDSNSKDSGDELPSTVTNAVIKRKRNSLDLDITHADAFDVMLEHIENMEHWAAFAEFNRDTSTLLSYGRFRNKVMNMSSLRYGAGKRLFNNFKDCCAIAGGVYNPKVDIDSIDKQIVNLAKGVTMAKINLRTYTAFKQLTSYPAYFSEANPLELAKAWNVPSTWDWAIENLPGFAERWQSRQAGDTRLREADTDWGIWRKGFVAKASRFGMTPNAAIDALTVATGAKAVYETKKARYLKDGYSEEQADRKALLDASFAYNETQQSSANAFVSAMQLNRTVASTALTVFRNASMGYNRRYAQAWNNLARRAKKGYKEQSIGFMAKQMEREGLTPEQARTVAERVYKRTLWHSLADIAIFGHVLQTAWNLAPYLPYLLAGDDSEEKNKMLTDALMHSLAGPVEGLSAGAQISEMYNLIRSGEGLKNYKFNLLPLMSDLQNIYNRFEKDGAAGINNIVNLGIQIGFGVNPQTLTDFAVATYDWFGGDPAITNEWVMWLMRVLQFPSSATENLYLDEIGMYADDAKKLSMDELAERYAKYKILKGAPLTFWAYSDEKEGDLMKSRVKQFEDKVKERLDYLTDDELMNFSSDDPSLKELADKVYGKRVEEAVADMSEFDMSNEFKDADPKKKREISKRYAKEHGVQDKRGEKKKKPAEQLYQKYRDFADMADDTLFEVEQAKAKADGDEDREEDISNAKKDITAEINYQLGDIDVNDEREIARAMNEIRKRKKEWLEDLKIK
ncbi:MAG: hypothetical protein J5510_07930 [Prevotella sp.]|nr:hypothetical protein [Prevotella sp.]